jgi:membrane associated rhomboid family serine protease
MGAYVLLHPRAPIETLLVLGFYISRISVPAWLMLGYWFLLQLLSGLPALGRVDSGSGVAFWAHIGGFAAGVALLPLFRHADREARARAAARGPGPFDIG